jgi:hypothetical protein
VCAAIGLLKVPKFGSLIFFAASDPLIGQGRAA